MAYNCCSKASTINFYIDNFLIVDNWAMSIVLFTLVSNYKLTLTKVIMEFWFMSSYISLVSLSARCSGFVRSGYDKEYLRIY